MLASKPAVWWLAAAFFTVAWTAAAPETVTEAWEPAPAGGSVAASPATSAPTAEPGGALGLGDLLIDAIIGAYRTGRNAYSVSRCPFVTSCSRYLEQAVRRHGFVYGTVLFVDRYFFRENRNARAWYRLVRNWRGHVKLDDNAYLE